MPQQLVCGIFLGVNALFRGSSRNFTAGFRELTLPWLFEIIKNVSTTPFLRSRKRFLLLLPLFAFFVAGMLVIEKRWSPVRGFLGVIELARLGDGDQPKGFKRHLVIPGRLVAHAGGGVDNFTYINSIDAIEENYRRGFRVFELDLAFTTDGKLVLVHEWQNGHPQSLAEFQAAPIYGRFRPTEWKTVVQFLESHKDAWIITDTKYNNLAILDYVIQSAGSVHDRIVPQIYGFTEYLPVSKMGFSSIILSNYKKKYRGSSLKNFAETRDVAITLSWEPKNIRIANELNSSGVGVFFHTVNEASTVDTKTNWGFYTDFVQPNRGVLMPKGS